MHEAWAFDRIQVNRLCPSLVPRREGRPGDEASCVHATLFFVREDSAPGSTQVNRLCPTLFLYERIQHLAPHTCTPRGNTVCMHNIQVYTQQDNTQLPLATYGYGMQPYVSPAMFSATDSHHTGKIMDQLHQHTVQILSVCQSYGVWGADTTQWKTAQRGRNDRTTGCGRRVPSNCSSDYLASKGSESSLETCTGSLIWEKKLPPTTAEEDRCAGDWGQPSP